ncbi:MAG: dipeptide epimerase [Saprospiraceae bacterium]
MKLHIHRYDLRLANTFTITHESRDVQPTVIVGLEDDHGNIGWGEATAIPYYGQSQDKIVATLEANRSIIETTPLDTPETYWATMHQNFGEHPFELCAMDISANDLYGKQQGKPLYEIWGLQIQHLPLTNYTIGIADIPEMVRKMKAMPWPLYKIKLGTDHDLAIIQALRQETSATFRIDANTGWTAQQTIDLAPALKALDVEFIEQPLVADNWSGQAQVFAESVLPIMADESCQREEDVAKCHGYFHGINIKLVKCGGLTPARRMIAQAKKLGMKVMVGCMTESSIGISAIAHLLPLLDYVDMDGALLLAKDIASGVNIQDGIIHYADRPGTGAELHLL